MGAKHFGRALLVALLCPSAAWALGLGDIKLNSALNAPLDADIELLGATPEELGSLKATLASRETFAKYGLDYPGFLSTVKLTRAKSGNGRDVLHVSSQETITEPAVTLLVDVNWGRGRLVREYTVLLDPPVFTPGNTASAPVTQAGTATARSGNIERSAPAASASTPASAASQSGETSGQSYNVRRGDTLSGIASGLANSYSGTTHDQLMLALYRGNTAAFDNSMNELRSGAILRLPAASAVSGISAAAAAEETSRQYAAWRGRTGAASGTGTGRLRLVAPAEGGSANGSAGTGTDAKGLRERVSQLENELTESRRMLELKNAELADLQRRLGAAGGTPAAAQTPASTSGATPEATPPPRNMPATPTAETPAGATPSAAQTPAAATTPGASSTPPPATPAASTATTPKRPRVVAETPAEQPSFLSMLSTYWYVPAALLAALLAFFGLRKVRTARSGGDDFAVARYDQDEPQDALSTSVARPLESGKPRRVTPSAATPAERGMVVEEVAAADQSKPAATRGDDTLSGETGINLDQSDPLAEADFHMAYGLYDQAADLMRTAIQREPQRRDLKLKLVEVFFVWGNRDEFLATARELHQSRAEAAPGEWEKIVIMGRQIAPEDPLFSGPAEPGQHTSTVDLDLHAGDDKLDFDVADGDAHGLGGAAALGAAAAGAGAVAAASAEHDSLDIDFSGTSSGVHLPSVDLDLGDTDAAGGESDGGDTAEFTAAFAPVDRSGATTREMAPQFASGVPDLQDLRPDLGEAPTVEQPQLRPNSPTIRQKIDEVLRHTNIANDQTAEVAIDDLGLDIGGGADSSLDLDMNSPDAGDGPAAAVGGESHADAPTLVAGLDEESRALIESAAHESGAESTVASSGEWFTGTRTEHDTGATASMAALDVDQSDHADGGSTAQLPRPVGIESTAEMLAPPTASAAKASASKVSLANIESTAEMPPPSNIDSTGTAAMPLAEELSLPALEPMTISEVGTKLDLARAYMDMGDPDGARSILQEVLHEGSISQKQEAQRLIDSLPG